jgi:hypothetical protein
MSGQENADNGNSPSSSPTGIVSAKSFKKPTITQAVDRVLISSGLLAAAASEQEAVSMAGLCGMIKVLCPEEDTKQIKKKISSAFNVAFNHPRISKAAFYWSQNRGVSRLLNKRYR